MELRGVTNNSTKKPQTTPTSKKTSTSNGIMFTPHFLFVDFLTGSILYYPQAPAWLPMENLYLVVVEFGMLFNSTPGSPEMKTGACTAFVTAIYNVIHNDDEVRCSAERDWVSLNIFVIIE